MIRTIKGVIEELRREDPESSVTEYAIRSWIKTGVLPSVKSGNKYLVDMDVLRKYLAGEHTDRNRKENT